MSTLILLRHGESEWNALGQFTGWVDVGLSDKGLAEAATGGELLRDAGLHPDIVHTSVLTRAIQTANIALDAAGLSWLPVRRSWRLNERHYGALQGKNKAQTREEYGDEQFMLWRRSYDVPPPPLTDHDMLPQRADPRYALLPDELSPRCQAPGRHRGRRDRRAQYPDRHPARLRTRPGVPAHRSRRPLPGPGSGSRRGRRGGQPGEIATGGTVRACDGNQRINPTWTVADRYMNVARTTTRHWPCPVRLASPAAYHRGVKAGVDDRSARERYRRGLRPRHRRCADRRRPRDRNR